MAYFFRQKLHHEKDFYFYNQGFFRHYYQLNKIEWEEANKAMQCSLKEKGMSFERKGITDSEIQYALIPKLYPLMKKYPKEKTWIIIDDTSIQSLAIPCAKLSADFDIEHIVIPNSPRSATQSTPVEVSPFLLIPALLCAYCFTKYMEAPLQTLFTTLLIFAFVCSTVPCFAGKIHQTVFDLNELENINLSASHRKTVLTFQPISTPSPPQTCPELVYDCLTKPADGNNAESVPRSCP